MVYRIAAIAMLTALIVSGSATATSLNGNVMMHNWTATDRCAAAAQKQFPDFTAESNAKRDNLMKQCLAQGNLPPRSDLSH